MSDPTDFDPPPFCVARGADCDRRLGLIEQELGELRRRLEALPTIQTLHLMLTYLDGNHKRLQTLTPAVVVEGQRTDEALRVAGVSETKVLEVDSRVEALTGSVELMLQRQEFVEKGLADLRRDFADLRTVVLNGRGAEG